MSALKIREHICDIHVDTPLFPGIGGSCLYAASHHAIASYFIGFQLAPFVPMSTFGGIGTLTAPKVIRK